MRFRTVYPFWIVLGIELAFTLYLVWGHRGMIGHDAFQYFGLQYYFLNNSVNAGDTAQWMPLMTHGTVSNWWYAVQAGIVQGALLALGPLNRHLVGLNFLPIYYLGILFDLTLLLLGVWLLGRRYFTSNLTVLFVCITSVGSAVWFTQPWHNLHFYFALPLIFHFIHELFDKGQWRYLLLAGNLFVIQCCGSLPYYIPLTSLVIFFYTFLLTVLFWPVTKGQIRKLLRNWPRAILPVALVGISLYALTTLLTHDTDLIANYNVGRLPDGSVSLDTFLTYGTNSNLRWFELLSRISASLDYSVYFGYLALAFAALALLVKVTRHLVLVAITALVVLLIANSTPIAAIFYYIWPTMEYFRHLSLASTIVRLLLCFVAGFGFEQILLRPAKEHRVKVRIAIFGLAQFAVMLFLFSLSYQRSVNWVGASVFGTLHNDPAVLQESYIRPQISQAALWCLCASIFFVAIASQRFSSRTLAVVAISIQALDIYSFKFDLSQLRTVGLNRQEYEINRLQEMPYSPRRSPIDYDRHSRGRYVPQNRYEPGASYWTADSYMFTDPPVNRGRADHWLWSFDDLLRAHYGEKLRDTGSKTSAFVVYDQFVFPTAESALKAAGITEDKIQFFSGAHRIASDHVIANLIASGELKDVLLISGANVGEFELSGANERVHLRYDVIQYDANNIRIRVTDAKPGTWLYYADVWHPSWHATVNRGAVPVEKANLGYKAVPLPAGDSEVHFQFQSRPLWLSQAFLNWNSLVWLLLVPSIAVVEMRRRPDVLP